MRPSKTKPIPDYATATTEALHRAQASAELARLDCTIELDQLAAIQHDISAARTKIAHLQATITQRNAERSAIRDALRSRVQPYLQRGASLEVAAAVTGLSQEALKKPDPGNAPDTIPNPDTPQLQTEAMDDPALVPDPGNDPALVPNPGSNQ